jgi:hypothetical protein
MTRWTTVGNAQITDGVMQRRMMAFLEVQEKLYDGFFISTLASS